MPTMYQRTPSFIESMQNIRKIITKISTNAESQSSRMSALEATLTELGWMMAQLESSDLNQILKDSSTDNDDQEKLKTFTKDILENIDGLNCTENEKAVLNKSLDEIKLIFAKKKTCPLLQKGKTQ